MKNLVYFLALLVSASMFSQSDLDKKILEMMEATGEAENIRLTIDNIIRLKERESAVVLDSLRWEEIKTASLDYDSFLNDLIPIYKKKYNKKEIEKITTFFNSPEGKAYLEKSGGLNSKILRELTVSVQELFYEMKNIYSNPLSDRFKAPAKDCSTLKTGSFSYVDNLGNEVRVTRSKGIQMEMVDGDLSTLKVEWTGNCEYKVWEYQEDNNYKGIKPYLVTIYEVNDNSYKCVFTIEGEDKYFESEMKILN